MRFVSISLLALAIVACQPALTPTEKAAKDRSECSVVAIDQSGFDPVTAEEPPVVERATGHLSASAADAGGAFALAGSCTAE